MIQIPELYRQLQCQFSEEIYKRVKVKRYGISSCSGSLSTEQLQELYVLGDILKFMMDNPDYNSSCNINKLIQNIDYL